MLTGNKLFEGETVSHVLASVLKDDPDLEELPGGLPPRVRELVERCLRKNPRRRMQSIGDARVLLEDYSADPDSFAVAAVDAPTDVPPPPSTLKRFLLPLAAAVAALAFGLLSGSALLKGSEEAGTLRFHVQAPEGRGFQLDSTRPGPVVISPDGTTLTFSAWDTDGTSRLFIRELDEVVARPLSGTEGAQYPFWSPDSESIGFFADSKLKKVSASGGQPLTLCDASDGKGGSWGSNGTILFAPGPREPIHSVPQLGGEPEPVTAFDEDRGDDSHRHPRWLPDGKHFLYLARFPDGSEEGQAVVGASIEGGEPSIITRSPAAAEYANGHLLYMRESTLMAQRFDPEKLELEGDPVPVADSVALISTGTAQGVFSASTTGILAYQSGTLSWGQVLRWRDREGELLDTVGEPARFWDTVEISPTGDTAAVRIDDGDNVDIWIVELDRNLRTRFSFSTAIDQNPTFSADGAFLYWENHVDQKSHLYRKAIGGSGEGESIATFDNRTWPLSWHPDGNTLMTTMEVEESPQNIDLVSFPDSDWSESRPWQSSDFIDYGGEFSPDGRWLVYGSNESGEWEIYVAPFPGPGRKWQVSTDGGGWPRWRGDGREILYESNAGAVMGVMVEDRGDGLAFSDPVKLFQHKVSRSKSWDVSDDGERFLVVEPEQSQDPQPITVVVNWPKTIEDQK
jgi:Tol biopolymer transport system component